MTGPVNFRRSWKTIKIVNVGGTTFAVQQRYNFWALEERNPDMGYAAFETFPEGRHRMVPLMDIIDNKGDVLAELDDEEF